MTAPLIRGLKRVQTDAVHGARCVTINDRPAHQGIETELIGPCPLLNTSTINDRPAHQGIETESIS